MLAQQEGEKGKIGFHYYCFTANNTIKCNSETKAHQRKDPPKLH